MAATLSEVEDLIREWTARIGDLKVQADQASAEKKIGMLNQIADLTRRKDRLMALADDLKQEEDRAREPIQSAVEKELADLDDAYRTAIRFFH